MASPSPLSTVPLPDRHRRTTRPVPVMVRQLARFTGIGTVMTLAYLALYVALQGALGDQGANVVAWTATAVADTAANRRLTFGISQRRGAIRAQVEGLLVFGTGMACTSGSLLALGAVIAAPGRVSQLGVLVVANVVAGALRFLLLRHWVFAPHRTRRQPGRQQRVWIDRGRRTSPTWRSGSGSWLRWRGWPGASGQ